MPSENKPNGEVEAASNEDQLHSSISPSTVILLSGWVGLLTGLFEIVVGLRMYRKNVILNLSPRVLWMAPIMELLIFLLIGIVLAILAWRFPRVFSVKIISFILAFISLLSVFVLLPELHIYASLALALGLGVQASRMIGKYTAGFYRIVRYSSFLLIFATVSVLVITFSWESLDERKVRAKLPAKADRGPNVLLITLDTVRAQNLSVYGYERRTTPNLEKIANEGVVFENAIAPSSWTLPSHATLMTGEIPSKLNVRWFRPLTPSHPTLAEELGDRGYESAGFVANYLFCSRTTGLNRGMIHYEDYPVSLGQMVLSSSIGQSISNAGFIRRAFGYHQTLNAKRAEELNGDFLDWVSTRDEKRPFFAFLNYFDAHEPLVPPSPYDKKFGPTQPEGYFLYQTIGIDFLDKKDWTKADAKKHINAYDSSISYLDAHLGDLFKKLDDQGILDDTIVIITSDHGESFGEHGFYGHGTGLYIETLRVPLLIRYPSRVPKSKRIGRPVGLTTVPATVLDLIGVKNQKVFPGASLGKYWDESFSETMDEDRPLVVSELQHADWIDQRYPASKGTMKSYVTDRYQFISNENGTEELYDLISDPQQLKNLIESSEHKEVVERFRSLEN